MVKFNFQKISQVPKNFFKKRKEISSYLREIKDILKEQNYNFSESFLILPKEKFSLPKLPKNFKLIIVIGIGGSSLGAQAIYEGLKNKKNLRDILFLDTLNPLFLREILEKSTHLKKGEIAVCFISKSGKTFETIANFFALFQKIKKYQPRIFVTTEKGSSFWQFAQENKWTLFEIPKMVGGRYSVFSYVGLLPLFLAGLKINDLLSGAEKANQICLIDNFLKNPALASALTIFYHYQEGKNIYSNLVFPPDLEYFGKWYVQMMAESLGKEKKGMTPIVTTGTTDFHAIGQLFFDGPEDKLINFVFVENLDFDFPLPKDKNLDVLFPGASGKKIWSLTKTIFAGVKRAYLKKKLPFTETVLEKLNEKNLGFLFQMKMIEIIFLAKLMKINAFDQPGVELYKKETQKILQDGKD